MHRLAFYSSIGAGVIIISHIVFTYFGFLHTDADSARYMLSALIQSEAAIVALVVTLSLVAVQLAASSYSARVIEVFRRTPDLWILMGIYGVTIFYGLGVLKMIEKANPAVNSLSNLEGHITFSYYLGVFAFAALVPYIWKMFELLKPSTVIDILAEKMTKENILSVVKEKSHENDPIKPIVDIIRGSLMKYDYETARKGLMAIYVHSKFIFKNGNIAKQDKYYIHSIILAHFTEVGKLAINIKNEEVSSIVIGYMKMIGQLTDEQNLEDLTNSLATNLRTVGEAAAKQKSQNATLKVISGLVQIGITSAKQKFESTRGIIFSIEIIAAEQGLEYVLEESTNSYKQLNDAAEENKLIETAQMALDSFKRVKEARYESKN